MSRSARLLAIGLARYCYTAQAAAARNLMLEGRSEFPSRKAQETPGGGESVAAQYPLPKFPFAPLGKLRPPLKGEVTPAAGLV